MHVIYSILLIPTSFSTLVPFDQSGNTCYNLKIKLNSVHVHRVYTLLYILHIIPNLFQYHESTEEI